MKTDQIGGCTIWERYLEAMNIEFAIRELSCADPLSLLHTVKSAKRLRNR